MMTDVSLSGQSVFSKELAGPREAPYLLHAGKFYVDIHQLDERISTLDIDDSEWVASYRAMAKRRQGDEFYNKGR